MPLNRRTMIIAATSVMAAGLGAWRFWPQSQLSLAEAAPPLPPPPEPLRLYHLGHSLVGRDMPAMLAQLAGHTYASQLGWGTSLKQHWAGGDAINGFDVENNHVRFKPARVALASGGFDAIVLTEMVDIRDALRYHQSADNLARWAALARTANPNIRIFLYESWPHRATEAAWLSRIDEDHELYWQDAILRVAAAQAGPIHLIPAGQVVAAYVRAGGGADHLFARSENGALDTIHMGDKGNYLVALAHFATLYHRDPSGLPHLLDRADGSPAIPPTVDEAALMQRVAWDIVRQHPLTGVAA